MVILSDSLDVDPGLQDANNRGTSYELFSHKPNVDSVRLWAIFFAPVGHSGDFHIPESWNDFFCSPC
jgi:hypothetical protein